MRVVRCCCVVVVVERRIQVRALINFRADTFWAGHRCFAPPDGPARSFRARSARGQIGDFVTVSWIWAGKSNPKRDTLEDIEARPRGMAATATAVIITTPADSATDFLRWECRTPDPKRCINRFSRFTDKSGDNC